MHIDKAEVKSLDVKSAVRESLKNGIEHFPPLMVDECLSEAPDVVAETVVARLQHDYPLTAEILGYPRKTFGIRPVAVASLGTRSIYKALVDAIGASLPDSSRGDGKWKAHKEFGLTPEASYVVEFDIASCYEYIDHGTLLEELVIRTNNPTISKLLRNFLGELQGRRTGLPQLSRESDALADTYLDILARRLQRDPCVVSRFADDFKVLAGSFEGAAAIIEHSSEYARDLGLVLSTEKTGILTLETLRGRHVSEEEILSKYFVDVSLAMEDARELMFGEYVVEDDDEEEENEDKSARDIEFAAYHSIFQDWLKASSPFEEDRATLERLQGLLPKVLAILRKDDEPISSTQLALVLYDNVMRIESVVKYIAARVDWEETPDPWETSYEDYWEAIMYMVKIRRQTPWMKLWIIYAARVHHTGFSSNEDVVLQWLDEQLSDRHELVRAEAAWVLARRGRDSVTVDKLLEMYQRATELTRPLLAACLAKVPNTPKSVISAVETDGLLMKEAVRWAKNG